MNNTECLYILYNVIKMLEDRGYVYLGTNYEKIIIDKNNKENNKENNISDYIYIFNNRKYNILFKNNNNQYINVFFLESFLINKDLNSCLKDYINYIGEKYFNDGKSLEQLKHLYLLCPYEYEEKIGKRFLKDGIFCETLKYMVYNPTQNIYFPKHEKIKNYKKKYKKFNLKLPVILESDKASMWYGYKNNEIIKITRKNKSIYYRIVRNEEN